MMPEPSIADLVRTASAELRSCSESPRLDAEILLAKVIGGSRAGLIAHGEERPGATSRGEYAALIASRLAGTPVAYLTGTREFWSMTLEVTPAVLVPRPETEILVELALRHLPRERDCTVLDAGTGSGAIAIAIASERPLARVTGTDISQEALDVASRNAAKLGFSRIAWRRGSWLEAVPHERFDLIVANPPYIAADDPALSALAAEPRIALSPGVTGLEAFEQIIGQAADHLMPAGLIILEHGGLQAQAVADLLAQYAFIAVRMQRDRAGLPRATQGSVH